MRICLFVNETAGGGLSLEDLTTRIDRAGHHVDRIVKHVEDLKPHLASRFDCVAAAGGDGTIARAARALAGGDVPLAIVPLGTANNIATSLSITDDIDGAIDRWSQHQVVNIDIGLVECDGKLDHFLESVGFGLVTDSIETGRKTLSKDDPDTHLEHARQLYVEMLDRLQPQRYSLCIEGELVEEEYLLVEVLNTAFIGPRLQLTAGANVADGLLSVVAITRSDKVPLANYLQALRDGSTRDAGFKSWRVPTIEVTGAHRMHVDDRIEAVSGAVKISVAPSALTVLA